MINVHSCKPSLGNHNGNPTIYLHCYYDALMMTGLLVTEVCVSLPGLIWAFHGLYTLHKQGSRISAFTILIIINDLVELFLSAITASYIRDTFVHISATKSLKKITDEKYLWFVLFSDRMIIAAKLFIACRITGLFLHQLVALQSMLSPKNQLCSTRASSLLCSTITCIILWLLAFGCQFLNIWINLIFIFFPCCILAITCNLTYKASAVPDHIKPSSAVLIVSTLTLITFSATACVVVVFTPDRSEFNVSAFLISLRVITDPLLCVLVSKEQFRIYKQQTHTNTEMNSEELKP